MAESAQSENSAALSPWRPLRVALFRNLLIADLVSDIGTFMQTMAARYAGKVQAYEIWNEENLSREMGVGNVAPASYLPILEAGTTGVRTGDPAALVLLGAPSPTGANIAGQAIDDLTYLQQLYAINNGEVKGFYDALSVHPSGFSNPPNCTPATPQNTAIAPSSTRRERSTSAVKSTWPGVSMMFTRILMPS